MHYPGGEVCDGAVVAAGEEAVQPEADVPDDVVVVAERAQEGAVRPRPHAHGALLPTARHMRLVQVHAVHAVVVGEHAP